MKLIAIAGPSGSGKTTLVKAVMAMLINLAFSISCTTRSKRGDEAEGKNYFFISSEEFKRKIGAGEFAEWQEVYEGGFYGTLKSEIARISEEGKNVIFDIDVEGAINLKKVYGPDLLTIIVLPPSHSELVKRLESRGSETKESLAIRLAKAGQEAAKASEFDKMVYNDDLNEAVTQLKNIIVEFTESSD